jgi:predicted GNAT family acetyltransferase
MSDVEVEVEVVDNPELHRFEARVDGAVAGMIVYRERPDDRLVLLHTEVDEALEGKGIGSRLAAGALDDIRSRGLTITPVCPFVSAYLKRHPEYADLVAPAG